MERSPGHKSVLDTLVCCYWEGPQLPSSTLSSAISRSQFVAAIFGAGILVLGLLGWLLGKITSAPLNEVFSYIAFFDRHFQPFMRGRINTESIFYYLSVISIFLLLSTFRF